jgi:DNA-binding transcriptional ArsR family regulator
MVTLVEEGLAAADAADARLPSGEPASPLGGVRVVDLVARLGASQGNLSGHLACLKDCRMVDDRPEGRAVFYRVALDDDDLGLLVGEPHSQPHGTS